MSSLRRKNILFINSMNFRQHQVKDLGFFISSEGDAIKIIEEQLPKAKVIDENPTQKYTSKI